MKQLKFLVGVSIFLAICIGVVSWKIREKQESRSRATEQVEEAGKRLSSRGDMQTPDPVFFEQIMNRKEKVAIIVYSTTYQQVRSELDEYMRLVNEKFTDKLEGSLVIYTDNMWNNRDYRGYCASASDVGEAFRIRKLLKDINQRDGITGVILVGKIPYIKWFQKRASINRTYGPHLYNIAPCSLCYEDLDARFTDEFKGNGDNNIPFCGNNLCETRVPTPAPQAGENCLNDGFNSQGDGTADIYYAGGNEGTEIWTAWIRPLITGLQVNGPVLDETNPFSELVQMKNMLSKMNDYLRANGNLDFKKGEVVANVDCFQEGNCGGDFGRVETKTFSEANWLFRSATVYEGVNLSAAGQPSFERWLAKDREKYFIIYNRSYAGPELFYHPRQVGGADAYIFSNQMRDQAARSLVTEYPVCAAANFWLNPRDNISIASLVNNPMSQAVLTAAATENSWSNHVATYFPNIEAGNNDVYGTLPPLVSFQNVPIDPRESDPRYAGKNNFYWVWRNSFLGKAWALQEKLFHTQGYEYNYAPKRTFMTPFLFGNPFVWWWEGPLPFPLPSPTVTPTPTRPSPTPTCVPPAGAIRMQGPEEGSKINYGNPTLMAKDEAPLNSCYPHDMVLSVWQDVNKIYSSGFIEDVIRGPGYATTVVVNPLLAPGNYQWRVNLKNTANQTTPFDLIPKFNFTVCDRLEKPGLVELYYGDKKYNGESRITVFKGDRLRMKIVDVSDPNTTCYPHNVIFNIWPEGGAIYIRSSTWQLNKINRVDETFEWTFETNDLDFGNYELRANLSNSSIDQNGKMHQWASRSIDPLIIRFRLIVTPTPTTSPIPTATLTPTPYFCSRCSTQYKFCQEDWRSYRPDCSNRTGDPIYYGLNCDCRSGSQERPGDDCRWQDCVSTVCDINCDGVTDFNLGEGGLDYRQLRDCIGSSRERRTSNCQDDCHFNRADYSQDGIVDIVDFSRLRNFCTAY